jgi:cation diffusion facilitator family transporter
VTLVGTLANVMLAALKGTGGVLLGSQALLADAVDSTGDLISDIVTLVAVRVARRPIDGNHPYGHGRIESVASMLIGGLLLLAAAGIAVGAINSLLHGVHREIHPLALAIAGTAVLTKESLYRWTKRVGRRIRSRVVESNAHHHRSDAMSSIAVLTGLGAGVLIPEADFLDAVASLIVTLFIVRIGVKISLGAVHELVDTEQDPKLILKIEQIALKVPEVINAHRTRTRRSGQHTWVDMDIEVDPAMSVAQAHLVAHAVKENVVEKIGFVADVQVHVEPEGSHLEGEGTVRGMPSEKAEKKRN